MFLREPGFGQLVHYLGSTPTFRYTSQTEIRSNRLVADLVLLFAGLPCYREEH